MLSAAKRSMLTVAEYIYIFYKWGVNKCLEGEQGRIKNVPQGYKMYVVHGKQRCCRTGSDQKPFFRGWQLFNRFFSCCEVFVMRFVWIYHWLHSYFCKAQSIQTQLHPEVDALQAAHTNTQNVSNGRLVCSVISTNSFYAIDSICALKNGHKQEMSNKITFNCFDLLPSGCLASHTQTPLEFFDVTIEPREFPDSWERR